MSARVALDPLASTRGRRLLLGLLYLSEGAPIGYLWWAIPAKLRLAGVPVEDVAALGAVLTLPWTLKFLWAPLVDALRSRRYGLRPWIAGAQLAMALTLLPLAFVDLAATWRSLVPLLVLHGVCAATQDVAIDALAVRRVPDHERGDATGWMQLGMLGGRAVFGGAALAAEQWLGARGVVWILVGAIAGAALLVLFARDRADELGSPALAERFQHFAGRLWEVARRPTTALGLAFAAVAGCAMEATGALAGPLLVDRGFAQAEVGRFFAVPAVVGMGVGVLAGGRLADRLARTRAVAGALLAMAVLVLLVAWSAALAADGSRTPLLLALSAAYVLFGVLTAASYALLMDVTDPRLGGTQFSAYMAAVNLCYVWAAWLSGRLAGAVGYPTALVAMAALSLLALPLLPALGRRAAGPRAAGTPGSSAPSV